MQETVRWEATAVGMLHVAMLHNQLDVSPQDRRKAKGERTDFQEQSYSGMRILSSERFGSLSSGQLDR